MAKIIEIEGIGNVFKEKLQNAGINTTEALLEHGASRAGRKKLAETTNIDESKILNWVNKADLFRIKGVGEEYSDLLEASGVDTVKELRNRVPENLHKKMEETNEIKKLVRQTPGLKSVEDWVNQAKELPPMVTY